MSSSANISCSRLVVVALLRLLAFPCGHCLHVSDDSRPHDGNLHADVQDPDAPADINMVAADTPLLATSTCQLAELHQYPIGLPNATWLPIAFEIEMFSNSKKLSTEPSSFSANMKLMKEKILPAVNYTGNCSKRMFEITDWTWSDKDVEHSWLLELEKNELKTGPLMYEATTPIALREDEAEIAIAQTGNFDYYFGKVAHNSTWDKKGKRPWVDDPPGLHMHVDSRCLKEDERRLVALLLIWEKFGPAIYNTTGVMLHNDTVASSQKAEAIIHKSETLLDNLLKYIDMDNDNDTVAWRSSPPKENLTTLFNRLESKKKMKGDKSAADGFRRFEVNVCHLIDVKCSHELADKNNVPKFGALEFRGFDPMTGWPLRLAISLVVRLVQFSCTANIDDQLLFLAAWDGVHHADAIEDLLVALDMDPTQFDIMGSNSTLFTTNFGGVPDGVEGAPPNTNGDSITGMDEAGPRKDWTKDTTDEEKVKVQWKKEDGAKLNGNKAPKRDWTENVKDDVDTNSKKSMMLKQK